MTVSFGYATTCFLIAVVPLFRLVHTDISENCSTIRLTQIVRSYRVHFFPNKEHTTQL